GTEAMRFAETQWTEALWDAEAAVCTKDRQLQLSTQLQKLAQAARATLERELKAFLQNMEQERSVLGELLQIHAQMWPYLGPPDRSVIQSQLDGLQEEWRILRRAAETSLYRL
uniref:Si:dkeyp-77c8.3 n=1 Tax=Paramormyrops kingsleyae TaxID=1676925 RepID=A0A3B3QZ21_9TELE